jgi:hypothetical protein
VRRKLNKEISIDLNKQTYSITFHSSDGGSFIVVGERIVKDEYEYDPFEIAWAALATNTHTQQVLDDVEEAMKEKRNDKSS